MISLLTGILSFSSYTDVDLQCNILSVSRGCASPNVLLLSSARDQLVVSYPEPDCNLKNTIIFATAVMNSVKTSFEKATKLG